MRTLYGYLWDSETQSEWPLYLEDGKIYGFPNSGYDGTPRHEVALLWHFRLTEEPRTRKLGFENTGE